NPPDAADWYSGFGGADAIRLRHYRVSIDDEPVELLVIHYRREAEGAELVSSYNRLGGGGWNWIGSGGHEIAAGDLSWAVRELRLVRGDRHRLTWSWYDIGGWQTTSDMLAKGLAALNRLTGRPGDATLVALGTEYQLQPDEARARLEAFMADHPQLLAPRGLIEDQ
ncbi:MAG: EpsI family protein, partial [Halofilum sp. (in: g-proteobacteria)]|nr:EpsI family protein [Halofilum sp. (in: g-proteobacteria)]